MSQTIPVSAIRSMVPAGSLQAVSAQGLSRAGHDHSTGTKAPVYDPDAIHLTANPRQAMQMVVLATGEPLGYKTPRQEAAYIESLDLAAPVGHYDPDGFLSKLGLGELKGSGRGDASMIHAVKESDYRPHFTLINRQVGIPGFLYKGLVNGSKSYQAVQGVADPLMAAYSNHRRLWDKPFTPTQTAKPTGQTPTERYPAILGDADKPIAIEWGEDFHSGTEGAQHGYGTYQIATALGFDPAQAKRIATLTYDVDLNKTPYGKTGPIVIGSMDRHFNFRPEGGEDTRILWARRHLEAAIAYGRQGAFDQAEIELGVGLHSLQDLFAHGQVSPSVHATLGKFVDTPGWSPVSFVEATVATRNYLRAYIQGIGNDKGDYGLPPEPIATQPSAN